MGFLFSFHMRIFFFSFFSLSFPLNVYIGVSPFFVSHFIKIGSLRDHYGFLIKKAKVNRFFLWIIEICVLFLSCIHIYVYCINSYVHISCLSTITSRPKK